MAKQQPDSDETRELLQRVRGGDREAFDLLFGRHRTALRAFIDLRLDPRVRARVDPSDVVQETAAKSPSAPPGGPPHGAARGGLARPVVATASSQPASRRSIACSAIGGRPTALSRWPAYPSATCGAGAAVRQMGAAAAGAGSSLRAGGAGAGRRRHLAVACAYFRIVALCCQEQRIASLFILCHNIPKRASVTLSAPTASSTSSRKR